MSSSVPALVLLAGLAWYVGYCDSSARGTAEQLCGSIQAGQQVSDVRDRMTVSTDDHGYLVSDSKSLTAIFKAAGPRQYVCHATHANGVITAKEISRVVAWTR